MFGSSFAAGSPSIGSGRLRSVGLQGLVTVIVDRLGSPAVRRKPIKYEVYDVLHASILAGDYAAGTWLRQGEIASRLGVSMTPVREALDLLVSAGLAERVPFRGVRILRPSGNEILDSYMLRLLLEGVAAKAAASRISEVQLLELRELLDRGRKLVKLDDLPQEHALSRELHSRIVAAAGNALLHRMYLTVLNTFPDWMLYEHLYRQPQLIENSMLAEFCEHSLIVDALAAHDPDLAVRRAVEHVTNRGREIETFLGLAPKAVRDGEAQILPLFPQVCMGGGKPNKEMP